MEAAGIERQKALINSPERYKFWDEHDFDKQFDIIGQLSGAHTPERRAVKCYFERWEQEHILRKDDVSKAKFLAKYGGLEFVDIDTGKQYKISSTELHYYRASKYQRGGWAVVAYTAKEERNVFTLEEKECALHDCIVTYYHRHPEKNMKVLLMKDQVEGIEWLASLEPRDDEETDSDSHSSSNAKPKATGVKQRASKGRGEHVDHIVRGNNEDHTSPTDDNGSNLSPCGGCGRPVGPVHKCDICRKSMHPFCGRTLGEEGYGSSVRCRGCDNKTPVGI